MELARRCSENIEGIESQPYKDQRPPPMRGQPGGKVYVYSGKDGTLLTSAWSAMNGTRSGRVYVVSRRVRIAKDHHGTTST